MSTAPVTPIRLTWVKSKIKGRHELTASGPILGSLQRVDFWKSVAQAEFKGKTWSFQRSSFARTGVLEEPGGRLVAHFKANWPGGGTLVFTDGQRFHLMARGFWRPLWSRVHAQGKTLLEVAPHEKEVRVTGWAGTEAWNSLQTKMPVLIMFSWHQVLQANDDAAATASISAAAAG